MAFLSSHPFFFALTIVPLHILLDTRRRRDRLSDRRDHSFRLALAPFRHRAEQLLANADEAQLQPGYRSAHRAAREESIGCASSAWADIRYRIACDVLFFELIGDDRPQIEVRSSRTSRARMPRRRRNLPNEPIRQL